MSLLLFTTCDESIAIFSSLDADDGERDRLLESFVDWASFIEIAGTTSFPLTTGGNGGVFGGGIVSDKGAFDVVDRDGDGDACLVDDIVSDEVTGRDTCIESEITGRGTVIESDEVTGRDTCTESEVTGIGSAADVITCSVDIVAVD